MDNLSKVPEQLKELMAEKGINSVALAPMIGIRSNSFTRYTAGTHLPKFEVLIALADYFQCSTDFLLGLTDYPRRENQVFKPTPPFAEQFYVALEKCKKSQYALHKHAGISWGSINSWINGRSLPTPESLVKMAKFLDCSVDFLLGRED